jgi:hypothetical protein
LEITGKPGQVATPQEDPHKNLAAEEHCSHGYALVEVHE